MQKMKFNVTWFVNTRIIGDLDDVELPPFDRLPDVVQSGNVRIFRAELLEISFKLGVVVVAEFGVGQEAGMRRFGWGIVYGGRS